MLRLQSVCKAYDRGRVRAVDQVDLQVAAGEFLVLVGGSGSGKTTTLKMINRLIEPSSGTIRVDGVDVAGVDPVQLRRGIGYVFQGIGLFPHLTVGANIAITPELLGWRKAEIKKRVDELLELVGLSPPEYRQRMPAALSGGQRQRVGVARALAARPRVMLMDEPFGALDPITRDALQLELKRLQKTLRLTVVMVTHDMTEALLLADRIAVMDSGRLQQVGTPHELLTEPANETVAALTESPKKKVQQIEALLSERKGSSGVGKSR